MLTRRRKAEDKNSLIVFTGMTSVSLNEDNKERLISDRPKWQLKKAFLLGCLLTVDFISVTVATARSHLAEEQKRAAASPLRPDQKLPPCFRGGIRTGSKVGS